MPSNLPIQPTKPFFKYFLNNRSQSRPLDNLNPNPVDNKYASSSKKTCISRYLSQSYSVRRSQKERH